MSAVRRMKYEMMLRERKQRKAAKDLDSMLDAVDASDKDRDEVKRFAAFLKESASMTPLELIGLHGADSRRTRSAR